MVYIAEPIEYDAATVEQEIRDALVAAVPGLVIAPSTLLDVLIRVLAPLWAEQRQLLTEQLGEIFQYYGEKILRVPRHPATRATGTATITVAHTNGYTVPAGTEMTVLAGDGTLVALETRTETVINNGASSANDVAVIAIEAGASGTGLDGSATIEQPDLTDVVSVSINAKTIGGIDAETVETYLNRLADTTPLLAFTLVNSEDFERDARNDPLVDRALVIPNYNNATSTHGVGGHFTVAVEQNGGDPGETDVRIPLKKRQQAMVPPNVVVHCIAPSHTAVNVKFAAKAYADWTTSDVLARAKQAVLDALDPARWGRPQTGNEPLWLPIRKVRYTDLIAVLEGVSGLETITAEGTADTASGSPNLTSVTNQSGWVNGQRISGPGIPDGARIISGAGTAMMVMSANATLPGTGVAISGAALTLNNGIGDVTLTGVAPLPGPLSVIGQVVE